MIHPLSVHPDYQRSGVGSSLVDAVISELLGRGAPTISATVTEERTYFWEKQGFERLPVFLTLKKLGDL